MQGAFSSRPIPAANIGLDRGLLLLLRRQLKAMPGAPSCLLGSLLLVFAFRGSWTSRVALPSAFRSLASTGAKHCDARRAERLGRSGGRGQRPAARRLALVPRGSRDFVPRSPSVTDDALPGHPLPPVLSRIYLRKPPTDEPTGVSRSEWKFWFSGITLPRRRLPKTSGESHVALLRVGRPVVWASISDYWGQRVLAANAGGSPGC